MPHQNSLGIFLRTLLLLAAVVVVGCVRPDPNPTPTPSPAEPTPSPTSTATPTATPTWPAPATPIPTGTPRPPSSAGEGPTARRFVFILDNSNSLLDDCFSVDQEPTHSEPRAAMRGMPLWVVEIQG